MTLFIHQQQGVRAGSIDPLHLCIAIVFPSQDAYVKSTMESLLCDTGISPPGNVINW
jgi:hypothetical protein